jgi:hypothetical protein
VTTNIIQDNRPPGPPEHEAAVLQLDHDIWSQFFLLYDCALDMPLIAIIIIIIIIIIGPPGWRLVARLTTFLCKRSIVAKSEEVKTGWSNSAKSSRIF